MKEKNNSQNRNSIQYRQTIDNLKSETSKLKEQMSIESTNPLPVGTESYIARLQDQEDTYVKKIKQEKLKRKELDLKIAEVQKKISEKRISLAIPKDKNIKESNETILVKIKASEHKLDKALEKYNEVFARNKYLREQVDALRTEKKISEEILLKLEEEHKIAIEEEQKMRLSSEKLKETSASLKKKTDELKFQRKNTENEMEKFNKEWKELDKIMDKDIKSEDIFIKDNTILTPLPALNDSEKSSEIGSADKSAENSNPILEAAKKAKIFEEAFNRIEEATNTTDVLSLVETFVQAEKKNYSLFSHVTQLTNDIQNLEFQIMEMKNEIEKYNNIGIRTNAEREAILKELEERLNFAEARADLYEKRYEKAMKVILTFKIGVQQILEKIGAIDMLDEEKVTESNLMQFLGIIELRTNEILQIFRFCQKSQNESPIESAVVDNEKKPIKIQIPNISEKEVEEDDSSTVLTKFSFLERIKENGKK